VGVKYSGLTRTIRPESRFSDDACNAITANKITGCGPLYLFSFSVLDLDIYPSLFRVLTSVDNSIAESVIDETAAFVLITFIQCLKGLG
jgi:hypothetical protein